MCLLIVPPLLNYFLRSIFLVLQPTTTAAKVSCPLPICQAQAVCLRFTDTRLPMQEFRVQFAHIWPKQST
ncbi:hypothetical protein Y032_0059g2972 [Ancylostoma ceylanicum]|nr:hypothetical protein Y032_0059g2972 [Ancylostoma ceylanicum]